MRKHKNIIYWIATAWLSLGMLSTGIVQVLQQEGEIAFILRLGYPMYFLTMLGIFKIMGVIAILVPRYPLLKEWAYAGFFFMMTGALLSHVAMQSPSSEILPSLLLIMLTLLSWYFRPPGRRMVNGFESQPSHV
jgi:uncharacterized membrane protein YphA (DoxX/SURF4 family)